MAKKNLFIITGAEGSGKTKVIDSLEKILAFYRINYFATSDPKEKGTQKIEWKKFQELAEKDSFILSFKKRDALVGVTYDEMKQAKNSSKPIVWELDLQWMETIKNEYPEAAVILLNGVGFEDLYQRFEDKGSAIPAATAISAKRSDNLNKWWHGEVDYIIDNVKDQSDKAAEEIKGIIEGNK
ncbi:MAG: hypothetical protein V1690_00915 [Candidatus Moraniibacteriota bacterium]